MSGNLFDDTDPGATRPGSSGTPGTAGTPTGSYDLSGLFGEDPQRAAFDVGKRVDAAGSAVAHAAAPAAAPTAPAGVAPATPAPAAPSVAQWREAPPAKRRTRAWLITALALVLVLVAGAAVAVWLNRAPSTDDAMVQLVASETTLNDSISRYNAELEALAAAHSESVAQADASADPLARIARDSDPTAHAAAVAAASAHRDALAELVVPEPKPAYTRGELDTGDLAQVEAAIDSVDAAQSALDAHVAELGPLHEQLTATDEAFASALATFGQTLPGYAAQINAGHPLASSALQDALTQAAADASTAPVLDAGYASWDTYMAAAGAVRADHVREAALLDAEDAWEAESSESSDSDSSDWTPAASDPPPSTPPAEETPIEEETPLEEETPIDDGTPEPTP